MITIERHPNLDNWLEVRHFGKLLDQFTCLIEAHRFASKQAKQKHTTVVNLDKGAKKYDGVWYHFNYHLFNRGLCIYYQMNITIGENFKVRQKKCGNYVLVLKKHKKKWCAPRRGLWLSSAGLHFGTGRAASGVPIYTKKKLIFFKKTLDFCKFCGTLLYS